MTRDAAAKAPSRKGVIVRDIDLIGRLEGEGERRRDADRVDSTWRGLTCIWVATQSTFKYPSV